MTRIERLEQKLARGETLIGTHSALPEPLIPEMLGMAGFDILWVDAEHSPLDRRDLNLMILSANLTDIAVFVRIPEINPSFVKTVLDMGADGIIFPNIRSVEDAQLAVASMKYPPEGIRGYGPQRCTRYGAIDEQEYIHKYSKQPWAVLQIEHWDSVEHLEEIMEVPGINMLCAGPCDLSGSLGKLALVDDPECKKWYDLLVEKAIKKGIPIGVSGAPGVMGDWLRRGVSWINIGGDSGYILAGAKALHQEMQTLVVQIKGK